MKSKFIIVGGLLILNALTVSFFLIDSDILVSTNSTSNTFNELHDTRIVLVNEVEVWNATINTPQSIFLCYQKPNDTALDIVITKNPSHGTLIWSYCEENNETNIVNCTYLYHPKSFYSGTDSFTYAIRDTNTGEYMLSKTGKLRIQITPLLTKPLLKFPRNYAIGESTGKLTKQVQIQVFDNTTFQQYTEDNDPWLSQRYNSCAVVANGGSLRGRKLGSEIDSHEIVFRLNAAPMDDFKEDVGTKFSIGFASVVGLTGAGIGTECKIPQNQNMKDIKCLLRPCMPTTGECYQIARDNILNTSSI